MTFPSSSSRLTAGLRYGIAAGAIAVLLKRLNDRHTGSTMAFLPDSFSDFVNLAAADVIVGDYLEYEVPSVQGGVYQATHTYRGIVESRSPEPGLDGKLAFVLAGVIGSPMTVRLSPRVTVAVRRRDPA